MILELFKKNRKDLIKNHYIKNKKKIKRGEKIELK